MITVHRLGPITVEHEFSDKYWYIALYIWFFHIGFSWDRTQETDLWNNRIKDFPWFDGECEGCGITTRVAERNDLPGVPTYCMDCGMDAYAHPEPQRGYVQTEDGYDRWPDAPRRFLTTWLAEAVEKIEELEEDVCDLEIDMDNLDFEDKIEELEYELDSAQSEIRDLREQIANNTSARLEDLTQELEEDKAELRRDYIELHKMGLYNRELESKVIALEKEIEARDERICELEHILRDAGWFGEELGTTKAPLSVVAE